MQITNGSVSRTYKPADYEGRTVSLSFVLDPEDNVDEAFAHVALLAERHARQQPKPTTVVEAPIQVPTMAKSSEPVLPAAPVEVLEAELAAAVADDPLALQEPEPQPEAPPPPVTLQMCNEAAAQLGARKFEMNKLRKWCSEASGDPAINRLSLLQTEEQRREVYLKMMEALHG